MADRVATTVKIDEDLRDKVDNAVTEAGGTKAEFYENALREYLNADRYARVEDRLARIEDAVGATPGGTPAEEDSAKKKNSGGEYTMSGSGKNSGEEYTDGSEGGDETDRDVGTDGGVAAGAVSTSATAARGEADARLAEEDDVDKTSDAFLSRGPLDLGTRDTAGKANRMANYAILTGGDRVTHHEIRQAVEELGGDSAYYMDTYPGLVEERLAELGWCEHPARDLWVPTESEFCEMMDAFAGGIEAEFRGDADFDVGPDETVEEVIEARRREYNEVVPPLLNHGVRTTDAVEAALQASRERQVEAAEAAAGLRT